MAFRFRYFLLVFLVATPSFSDDGSLSHKHAPIIVRSRPVIERLRLEVIEPVDVVVNSLGETLVADRTGKVVFRIDSEGETSLLGRELVGLARVADSKSFGVHALVAGKNSGRIIRLMETGFQEEVCELGFAPAGLAADTVGNLWTTNPVTGEALLFGSEGQRRRIVKLAGTPRDIAADDLGATVLLTSGSLISVAADGSTNQIGYVTPTASRVQLMADGSSVALATNSDGKTILVRPTADRGETDWFGGATDGTIAFAFDKLGNVTLANPAWRAVTRVTNRFTVPCPHCGEPVPMLFSPTAPAHEKAVRRSF